MLTSPLLLWRAENNLTQQSAADRLGVSKSFYRQLEDGIRPLPDSVLDILPGGFELRNEEWIAHCRKEAAKHIYHTGPNYASAPHLHPMLILLSYLDCPSVYAFSVMFKVRPRTVEQWIDRADPEFPQELSYALSYVNYQALANFKEAVERFCK